MKHLLLATFAILSALTSSVANASDLKPFDLPALTVSLPAGEITRQGKLAGAGSLLMSMDEDVALKSLAGEFDRPQLLPVGARQINVQWDAFPVATDKERRLILNAVMKALPITDARILREHSIAADRNLFVIGLPEIPIVVSFIDCSAGRGVTITLAFTRDIEVLLAAATDIAKSVVCKPVTGRDLPMPAYRLPKNFGMRPDAGLDMLMSLEGEVLVALFAPEDVQRMQGMFVKVMGSMMGGALGIPEDQVSLTTLNVDTLPNQRSVTAVMKTQGELDGAILNVRYCESQQLSLIVLWYAEGGSQEQAIQRIRQVGCPGEPTEPVASIDDLFGGQCKEGNQFACEVLKNLDSM